MKFRDFSYQFDAGPFSSKKELPSDNWDTGNCRRMLQWYFFVTQKIFLHPKQILCPDAYNETGRFVFPRGHKIDFDKLQSGDVIYAERIRSKNGDCINKGEETFPAIDDYIISLHTAIYTGEKEKEILHATSIEGKSCIWSLEKFTFFYHPVAIKRIVTLPL